MTVVLKALLALIKGFYKLVDAVPTWAFMAVILSLWAASAFHAHQRDTARTELDTQRAAFLKLKAAVEKERRAAAQDALDAQARYNTLKAQSDEKQRLADEAATQQRRRLEADVLRLRGANDGMHDHLRRLAEALSRSSPGGGPATALDGTTGAALVDVLGRCVDRYRAVAEAADRARIAGQQCESNYDALTHVKEN